LVGGDDDGVRGQPLAAGEPDGRDPPPGGLEPVDGRAVPEGHPGGGRRGGQRVGDGGDPAHGVPDTGPDVELGDDGVGGDGPER
jgi:hypothetical protein